MKTIITREQIEKALGEKRKCKGYFGQDSVYHIPDYLEINVGECGCVCHHYDEGVSKKFAKPPCIHCDVKDKEIDVEEESFKKCEIHPKEPFFCAKCNRHYCICKAPLEDKPILDVEEENMDDTILNHLFIHHMGDKVCSCQFGWKDKPTLPEERKVRKVPCSDACKGKEKGYCFNPYHGTFYVDSPLPEEIAKNTFGISLDIQKNGPMIIGTIDSIIRYLKARE